MKEAIPCTVRYVHPPGGGYVALTFDQEGSDEVIRLTIPEDQAVVLNSDLFIFPLSIEPNPFHIK